MKRAMAGIGQPEAKSFSSGVLNFSGKFRE